MRLEEPGYQGRYSNLRRVQGEQRRHPLTEIEEGAAEPVWLGKREGLAQGRQGGIQPTLSVPDQRLGGERRDPERHRMDRHGVDEQVIQGRARLDE